MQTAAGMGTPVEVEPLLQGSWSTRATWHLRNMSMRCTGNKRQNSPPPRAPQERNTKHARHYYIAVANWLGQVHEFIGKAVCRGPVGGVRRMDMRQRRCDPHSTLPNGCISPPPALGLFPWAEPFPSS